VALFSQQSGGHRRIHAPTHRYQYFHASSLPVRVWRSLTTQPTVGRGDDGDHCFNVRLSRFGAH
jgi:hypothetical protein